MSKDFPSTYRALTSSTMFTPAPASMCVRSWNYAWMGNRNLQFHIVVLRTIHNRRPSQWHSLRSTLFLSIPIFLFWLSLNIQIFPPIHRWCMKGLKYKLGRIEGLNWISSKNEAQRASGRHSLRLASNGWLLDGMFQPNYSWIWGSWKYKCRIFF